MNDIKPKFQPSAISGFWKAGMNSWMHPTDPQMPKTGYSFAENTLHRGGIVQTRPGGTMVCALAGERLQGFTIFRPRNDAPRAMIAIDGAIFTATFPFREFQRVDGLSFDPDAEFIVFKVCIQSITEADNGVLTIINPQEVVVIQDGTTRAGYWTGSKAEHTSKIPAGLWMEWVSARLWIVAGTRVFASNIANPLSFTEDTYLAERSAFELPGVGTGILRTANKRGLLVFTETTTTAFKSGILDRNLWQSTPDFQDDIFPEIGCVAGRTAINQYGLSMWLSRSGIVSFDSAKFSEVSARLLTIDDAMYRSKRNISADTNSACAINYENFAFFSVPSGDRYNAHTWALDFSPSGESSEGALSWSSVWSGFRPVQWATITAGGRERIYCASVGALPYDEGKTIHVWEFFNSSGDDNGERIACQLETAAFASDKAMRAKYLELDLTEISGEVTLKAYVGGTRGAWHEVLNTTLMAQQGCFGSPQLEVITPTSTIQSFRPQTRKIRSEEFILQDQENCHQPEGGAPGVDKAFQVLLQWRGRMGVKTIQILTNPEAESDSGECNEPETVASAVNEAGEEVE